MIMATKFALSGLLRSTALRAAPVVAVAPLVLEAGVAAVAGTELAAMLRTVSRK